MSRNAESLGYFGTSAASLIEYTAIVSAQMPTVWVG